MSSTNALAAPAQVQPTALAVPSRPTWDLIEVNPAVDVDDILSIVKKRLPWLIALPAACVVVALIYVYLIATPMFKSSAMIFIDPNFDSIIQVENVGAAVSDIDSLNSMEKAIVSDSMILRVIDKLNLRSDLDFLPKSLHKMVQSGQEISGSRLLAEIKKSRISASLIRPTRLLELTVFDTSPQRAQLIARTFVDEFELFLGEQKRQEAGNSSVELRRQADEAYRRALASETALEEFRMKNPGMTVEQDHQLFGERLTKIGDELNNISGRVLDLQSKVETLRDVDPKTDPLKVIKVGNFSELEHVSELLNQRLSAHANFAAVEGQYTERNPRFIEARSRVVEIDTQLQELAAELKASLDADYAAALTNEKLLTEKVASLQRELTTVKKASSEFRAIQQRVETEWQVHEALQHKIGETSLVTEKSTEIATLMSEPIVSHRPAKPSKPIAVLAGGFLGGLLSLGLIGFDLFQGGPFVSRRQMEDRLRVPVTAEIDTPQGGIHDRRLQEAMTKVLLSAEHRGARFFHVSSVWEEDHGVNVAGCLATASAHYGCPTLLISVLPGGDPRALVNLAPQPCQVENLHTLQLPASFLVAPNYAWQLLGPHRQHFGRIVIESTSLSQQSEIPAVIASFADANLLLVKKNRGNKREIEDVVNHLSRGSQSQMSLVLVA